MAPAGGRPDIVSVTGMTGTLPSASAPIDRVPTAVVLNGIDGLAMQGFAPLRRLRVGLITNHTGHDRNRRATIDLLRSALIANAADVGAHLQDRLKGLMDKHAIIGDVRGKGLMIGVELVRDRQTKERATEERNRLVEECFRRGLLVLGAGRNAIRLSPPLVLTRAQADTAVGILDQALGAVTGRT